MRAADTNVIVRLLARDDGRQSKAAEEFVRDGAWVSHIVLVEVVWVLSSVYQMKPAAIADAVDMLLDHRELIIQDPDVAAAALARYRDFPGVGFSDCMVLESARKAGHLPLGTFDRALGRIEGTRHL